MKKTIKIQAKVVQLDNEYAWIKVQPPSRSCADCDPQTGCKSVALTRLFHHPNKLFRVRNPLAAQTNEEVWIAIPEKSLLHSAIWAYAMPLLLLIAGAALGRWTAPHLFYSSLVGGSLGLILGFLLLRTHHYLSTQPEPTIIAPYQQSDSKGD